MKLKATLLLLMLAQFSFGQQKWAFHTSAEETILLGDQRSSSNFANLNTLAANSGMRAGIYRNVNELFAIEATLGVVGSGSSSYSTKIVPVEVIGHYDILPMITPEPKEGMKFNVDFGVGSALVRAQSASYNTTGSFGFSENLSLGASLDLPVLPNGVLSFGYRHTMFIDDYIDANLSGSDNDQLGRFFTAVRVNMGGISKKDQARLNSAITKADQVAAELAAAEAKVKGLEKEAAKTKALERELKEMQAAMADSIAALKAAKVEVKEEKTQASTSTRSGYAVIVASYNNKTGAMTHADELGPDSKVIHAEEIDKYRVAYGVYSSYGKAKEVRTSLKDEGTSCWIIKL